MNTEELKIVMELISKMSGDASSVAIVYFVAVSLVPVIKYSIGFTACYLMVKAVITGICADEKP